MLHSFQGGSDGATSRSGLVTDAAGNLYGATTAGGDSENCTAGCGTIFELSPPASQGGAWTENVLYRFQGGSDGFYPVANLIFDKSGNLYGTTVNGGASGYGTVYELSPASGSGEWTEVILHSFIKFGDGHLPYTGLIFGKGGGLYGSTPSGGGASNNGMIYRLMPQAGSWVYQKLYSFEGGFDAGFPLSTLVADTLGNLYGTSAYGGITGLGTVFVITFSPSGSALSENVLYNFQAGGDGNSPQAGLIFDQSGNLYGTTAGGGTGTGAQGTVFKLTPPTTQGAPWNENILHSFTSAGDGKDPVCSLVFAEGEAPYGTTLYGGASDLGVIFRIEP